LKKLLFLLLMSCDNSPQPEGVFIALQRDFADFLSWQKFDFGDAPLAGHPVGARYGYVKEVLQPGEKAYPVGDIIVKTVEVPPSPSPSPWPDPIPQQQWDLFAMAKRGGDFNASGARNWEFFTLRINPDGVPVILARGIDASDVPDTSGGHGYTGANGNVIRCNNCHGDPTMAKVDYILNPQLEPK
jgi:hypothetical protein